MADPVSLGLISAATLSQIGTAATVAGGAISAGSAIAGGYAKSNMDQYQAGMAMTRAAVDQGNANYAFASAQPNIQQAGLRGRAEVGRTRAAFGAGNIATGVGSTKDVVNSESGIAAQNEGVIASNAAKRAYGYEVESTEDVNQAQVYDKAASNDKTAGYIGALGSFVGTAGSVANKWVQMGQAFGNSGSGAVSGDFDPVYSPYGFNTTG